MEYSKFIETKDTQLLDTMCDPEKKKHFLQYMALLEQLAKF